MKVRIAIIYVHILVLSLIVSACSTEDRKNSSTEQDSNIEKEVYTCSMHPEVISEKPGKCPKCGMDLIVKESKGNNSMMNVKNN